MSEDPITAVADALAETERLLTQPLASEELSHAQRDYVARITEFESILTNPNEALRSAQLGAFTDKLLLDAGYAAGLLSGRTIRVPVEHFTAFIESVGALIEQREQATANQAKPAN